MVGNRLSLQGVVDADSLTAADHRNIWQKFDLGRCLPRPDVLENSRRALLALIWNFETRCSRRNSSFLGCNLLESCKWCLELKTVPSVSAP